MVSRVFVTTADKGIAGGVASLDAGGGVPLAQLGAAVAAATQKVTRAVTASTTLVLADASELVVVTATAATTVTVPPNSAVPFPVGTVVEVAQGGTGQVTVAGGAGVTVAAPDGGLALRTQYSRARLIKTGTDTWYFLGDTGSLALPVCQVRQTVAQSIAAASWVPLVFGVADEDPDGLWSAAAPDRVTIKRKGLYRVSAAANTVGSSIRVGVQLQKNGVALPQGTSNVQASSAAGTAVSPVVVLRLNPADYVAAATVQGAASATNTFVVADNASMMLVECIRLLP